MLVVNMLFCLLLVSAILLRKSKSVLPMCRSRVDRVVVEKGRWKKEEQAAGDVRCI